MAITTYRTGQAAKLLGVSSHHLRRLCEAGEIEADLSAGSQWRIHASEVERLRKEGVPPIPQLLPENALAADKPKQIPDESDAVRTERESVEIAQSRLHRRQLELQREQVEDGFRERERLQREAERAAARNVWANNWREAVQKSLPVDVQPSIRLAIVEAVDAALNRLSPSQPMTIQKLVVESTVEAGLQAYFREKAISQALNGIPAGRQVEARLLAGRAIDALGQGANYFGMTGAATGAVEGIASSVEHDREKALILNALPNALGGLDQLDVQEASAAVAAALRALPVGCGRMALQRAREDALAPFRQLANQRKTEIIDYIRSETERRLRVVRHEASARDAVRQVGAYLDRVYEFKTLTERYQQEDRLKALLAPEIMAQLESGSLNESEDLRAFVEEWIDDHIELDDDGDSDVEDDDEDEYDDESDDEDEEAAW